MPKYLIIAFGAEWCAQCKKNRPALDKLHTPPLREVRHIDVDKNPELADDHGVTTVPLYIVWQGNRQIGRTNDIEQLSRMVAH